VSGLWNDHRTPQTPDEWKRVFHVLRRHYWSEVEDAIAWGMRFLAEELPRLSEIAGHALAAAASSTLENSFSRASQLRTRVSRDLMTHLRIYSELQKRVLVTEDTEDADGGKDPDSADE
jgi:hypothetical protein